MGSIQRMHAKIENWNTQLNATQVTLDKSICPNVTVIFPFLLSVKNLLIVQASSFSCCFSCQILTDFDQVNVRIPAVISPDEHFLDWSSSALLDSPSIMFLVSIWSSGSLRSFTFTVPQRRNDLLRSLYYSSLNQHCIICLDHLHLILLRHIIGDIERRLIFRSFYIRICSTVIKISLIYITNIRISSYRYQHLQQIHISAQYERFVCGNLSLSNTPHAVTQVIITTCLSDLQQLKTLYLSLSVLFFRYFYTMTADRHTAAHKQLVIN